MHITSTLDKDQQYTEKCATRRHPSYSRFVSRSSLPGGSGDVTSSTAIITRQMFSVLKEHTLYFCNVLTSSLRDLSRPTGENTAKRPS